MKKLEKLRNIMQNNSIDNVVVTSPNNIFYLIGYAPNQLSVSLNSNIATLHITQNSATLITMDYEAQFIKQMLDEEVEAISYKTWTGIGEYNDFLSTRENITVSSSVEILKSLLVAGTVGLELDSISHSYIQNFESYTNITQLLLEMRKVKTDEEIETFRKLCKIQTKALKQVALNIKPGISEQELYSIYKQEVANSNYCVASAWTMLCSGINSAYLSTPTNRQIHENDMIKFDGGVNLEFKYFTTDMSRSFVIGENPVLSEIKKVLVKAQQLIISNMKPGVKCSELFNIGMDYVKSHYPGYVRGHLGHSISFGPSTFEPPFINASDNTVLEPGMILCIEVPFYASDIGGMNIEDMVLITNSGHEVLTADIDHYEYEKLNA